MEFRDRVDGVYGKRWIPNFIIRKINSCKEQAIIQLCRIAAFQPSWVLYESRVFELSVAD